MKLALALLLITIVHVFACGQARTAERLQSSTISSLNEGNPPLGSVRWVINARRANGTCVAASVGETPIGSVGVKTADGWMCLAFSGSAGGGGTWGSIIGTIASQSDLQAALNVKQNLDADLTDIGTLAPANNDMMMRLSGAWVNRSIAQLKTSWAIDLVDNTSDITKNAAFGTLSNKAISGLTNTLTNIPAGSILGVIPIANLATGTPTGSKFIRDDGTLQVIPGGGDVLSSGPLSQLAATTSAQLAGVITNETGTGSFVLGTSPNIITPTGIVKSDVGLGNVDNTPDTGKPISALTQTALNLKAPIAAPVFTSSITTPSLILGAVTVTPTGTELNFVDGVTQPIQNQLDAKVSGPGSPVTDRSIMLFNGTSGNNTDEYAGFSLDVGGNLTVPGSVTTGDGLAAGEFKLFELTAGGSEYRSWMAPDALTATVRFRFSNTSPTTGQTMIFSAPVGGISDVTFGAGGGGGTPGGLDTYVQFNDVLALGGDSGFTFNKTTNTVTADVFATPGSTPTITWSGSVVDRAGTGSPEGVVTAAIGSTWRRTDGGASTVFYTKESGAGNTGWVAVGAPGVGTGDVVGPSASTNGELPLFDLTTGKLLKRSNSLSGIPLLTAGVVTISNLNDTSDANKPVSTAQQTALNLKANIATPTFTTSITTPVMITGAADPADAGAIRLGNVEEIAWEASPAGTDITMRVNASEQFVFSGPILNAQLVTPALGIPTSGVGTNLTGIPLTTGVTGTLLPPNGGSGATTLTGLLQGNGTSAFTAITTSAGIAGIISDEWGSGALLFGTSPKILTSINDTNNNELIKITATGSAVNEITVANAAVGNGPTISTTGDDTDVDLNITTKGAGTVVFSGATSQPNATITDGVITNATIDGTNDVTANKIKSAATVPALTAGGIAHKTGSNPGYYGFDDGLGAGESQFRQTYIDTATYLSAPFYAVDSVGTDAYAITLTPAITALSDGLTVHFKAGTSNTGAATLAVNGIAAKALVKSAGGLSTALANNDVRAGDIVIAQFSSVADNFQVKSVLGNTGAGSGTVTHTAGNLTANSVVLGAGVDDTKVVAGIITDGTSKLTLGVAGTSVGSVDFKNATSGTITLAPVTGALGTVTLSVPAATDTLVGKATTDNLTNKTLSTGTAISASVTYSDGVKQTFNPDGTNAGINAGSQAGDPSAPANGDLWYDSTANEMTARINGANVALGAGGVGLGDSPTWTGIHTFSPTARSSGVAPYLTINAPADTNLTASTESIGVSFVGADRQHATGALTLQRGFVFGTPTYSFVGASTITTASAVDIPAAPIAGTNATITDSYALTVGGRFLSSVNGALSAPAVKVTGTPITGGNGTTTFPLFDINTAGATARTNQSTSGTMFGINAPSGFAGDLVNFYLNGTTATKFSVASDGSVVSAGSITAASANLFRINGRSRIGALADSQTHISNSAGNGLQALILGPSTSPSTIGAAPAQGQQFIIHQAMELLTIAAATSTTTTMQIPAGVVVMSVSVRVVTVVPTASTFTVTVGATTVNTAAVSTAATTTNVGTAAGHFYNGTTQGVTITPDVTPGAGTGQVRVTVTYAVTTPPSS